MKLSDLPIDALQSSDTLIVVSNGESQRVAVTSLIYYLKNNAEFVRAIVQHPHMREVLVKEMIDMMRDAGLDVEAGRQLASGAGNTSNYVVPGQQLRDPTAEIEVTGDVEIREE